MNTNPVHEWLARVAAECGSPMNMLAASVHVKNYNSQQLIAAYARAWGERIRTGKRA